MPTYLVLSIVIYFSFNCFAAGYSYSEEGEFSWLILLFIFFAIPIIAIIYSWDYIKPIWHRTWLFQYIEYCQVGNASGDNVDQKTLRILMHKVQTERRYRYHIEKENILLIMQSYLDPNWIEEDNSDDDKNDY